MEEIALEILNKDERNLFSKNKNLDKSYRLEGVGNFRVNLFIANQGLAAVIRILPVEIPTPEKLGIPESLMQQIEVPKGLILVTGTTGSGKSTTLASMIQYLNQKFPLHILTLEDPIEYIYQSEQALIQQREIGQNCESYSQALKYALRQDPDVILVGELRDLETISLALTAAETGHLVFATLHTRTAAASIDRMVESFPVNQQAMARLLLSESLKAVVSQVLIKDKSGKGRVAAFEVLINNLAVSNLIREGKSFQIPSHMQTGSKDGMVTLENAIRELVTQEKIDATEAEKVLAGFTKGTFIKAEPKPIKPKEVEKKVAMPIPVMKNGPRPLSEIKEVVLNSEEILTDYTRNETEPSPEPIAKSAPPPLTQSSATKSKLPKPPPLKKAS
jgi:twitching motility protein PilT